MATARILAFVQFMIAGIGAFALNLMMKLHNPGSDPSQLAEFAAYLARHGLWLIAVPVLWVFLYFAMNGRVPEKVINVVGGVITVALLLLVGVPLAFYLR